MNQARTRFLTCIAAFLSLASLSAHAESLVTSFPVGANPEAITVDVLTDKTYVINTGGDSISVTSGTTTSTITVGNGPTALAVSPTSQWVFVANGLGNSVTVVDTLSGSKTTLPVGDTPSAIAVNPVTNKFYVANKGGNSVSVIDGATLAVTTIPVGNAPVAIAVNPANNKIYVACYNSDVVTIIDGATGSTSTVATGSSPAALTVDPVMNRVYVANKIGDNVTVINGDNGSFTTNLAVGNGPAAIAVNPATNLVYVANSVSDTVTVFNGSTRAIVATLAVGSQPSSIGINMTTNRIYVANKVGDSVSIINGVTNTVAQTIGVGNQPVGMVVNPVTNRIYVLNKIAETVSVLDGASNAVTNVGVGLTPSAFAGTTAVDAAWSVGKAFVANQFANNISIVDGAAGTASAVAAGSSPIAVAVNQATNTAFVANRDSDSVTVVNASGAVQGTVTVGTQPVAVAVDSARNRAFVANQGSGNLSVIDGATLAVTTIPVGAQPVAVAVNANTGNIYVALQSGGGLLAVVDGATNVVTTTAVGTNPTAIAINRDTNRIYVANAGSAGISIVNGASPASAGFVATGGTPTAIAVNRVTNKIYVANQGGNSVTVIDGVTLGTNTLAGFSAPVAISVDSARNKIYVANRDNGKTTVIDGLTNSAALVTVGDSPSAVAADPVSGKAFVANRGSSTVSIITPAYEQPSAVGLSIGGLAANQTSSLSPTLQITPSGPAGSAALVHNAFFRKNDVRGTWTEAPTAGSGYDAIVTVPGFGTHVVLAHVVGGFEGNSHASVSGFSPLVSKVAAYAFTVVADSTPDGFSFTAQSSVATSTQVTSNSVTIGGINSASAISVTGGEYSIGCGAVFTSAAGTIASGQSVCVRHTSAAAQNASVSTTLTVGGVSGTFTSTTASLFMLSVSRAGAGAGTVTSSPSGISCGATCASDFASGTVVNLSVLADAGSVFNGWSGACSGTGACSVTMSAATAVTATFGPAPVPTHVLSVAVTNGAAGSVTGSGIDCPGVCSGTFDQGTVVALTATPVAGGATFLGWTGACSGTAACSVTMDAAKSVGAAFASAPPPTFVLSVTVTNGAAGSVTGTGIACPGDCTETLDQGTVVALTATPVAGGATFVGWTGDCSGTAACSVTMDAARSVGAAFASAPPPTFVLSVTVTNGAPGSVTGTGIDCPGDCTETLDQGTVVALTATPVAGGATFVGWTGDCSGTGACSVTMDAARSVGAEFASAPAPTYVLTVTVPAGAPGSVTGTGIDCPGDCTETLDENTSVSLTATPSAGAVFLGWSGACNGSGACTVNMNAAKSVTAFFGYTLTVDKTGSGDGSVSSEPSGISCGATCSAGYSAGTLVTLTATADTRSIFAGWSGACSGMGACTVTLDAAKTVGAAFTNAMSVVTSASDFDGDGISDVLWRNTVTGAVYIWFMKRIDGSRSHLIMTVPTRMGDRGHGRHQRRQQGRHPLEKYVDRRGLPSWLMNGSIAHVPCTSATIPLNWKIIAIDDFDGDSNADILWRETTTGEVYVWFMRRDVRLLSTQPGRHSARLGHRRHGRHELRWPGRHRVEKQRHRRSLPSGRWTERATPTSRSALSGRTGRSSA